MESLRYVCYYRKKKVESVLVRGAFCFRVNIIEHIHNSVKSYPWVSYLLKQCWNCRNHRFSRNLWPPWYDSTLDLRLSLFCLEIAKSLFPNDETYHRPSAAIVAILKWNMSAWAQNSKEWIVQVLFLLLSCVQRALKSTYFPEIVFCDNLVLWNLSISTFVCTAQNSIWQFLKL